MGILSEIIRAVLHLFCVALDIAILLLLFRILGQWRPIRWVQRINDGAKGVINALASTLCRPWEQPAGLRLTTRGALALSVLTLSLARYLLGAIAGVLP
jgi:hypothetical protein